ncbi:Nucleophile aminohydrolase, N-terminal [Parasponia andersonii]|uniref:Nucleophile aminohydrolase, N-terminal n=1 Tax=Parasponia andersonii TaxID=3476 RepID=A0A2P5DBA9_PARAD|nr:Nucleophile aminohydrolase, N-terminal [Parasponia andersonii]
MRTLRRLRQKAAVAKGGGYLPLDEIPKDPTVEKKTLTTVVSNFSSISTSALSLSLSRFKPSKSVIDSSSSASYLRGTSVVALKYKDGILMGSDMGGVLVMFLVVVNIYFEIFCIGGSEAFLYDSSIQMLFHISAKPVKYLYE